MRAFALIRGGLVAASLACTADTAPEAPSSVALFPVDAGMSWLYVSRDTVIAGAPLTHDHAAHYTVQHSTDITALGTRWLVLENGGILFDGLIGETTYLRNGADGVYAYGPGGGIIGPREYLFLPSIPGHSSTSWTLVDVADSIVAPAGTFEAYRYESTPSPIFPVEVTNMLWVVPDVGIVRTLHGLVVEEDNSGNEVRRWRTILELEGSGGP